MAKAWGINESGGAPEYNAQELRRIESIHLYPGVSDRTGARQGVRPTGQDVVTVSGTTWTQHDLSAVVYPGLTSSSGPYVVEKLAESGSLDPADGSNPRLDALDLQVRDDDEDASGFRDVRVVYVPGTPAGSPIPPALTATSLRLATILVPAGGSPAPSVDTLAQHTVSAGGVLPVRDDTERPGAGLYDGMTAFNQATGALEVRSGGAWPVAGSVHGYQLRETVVYTASDTFAKANHDGIRAVRIKCQAGGGGGGGAASSPSGEAAVGGGGGGGGYAEAWVLAAALTTSETVTVGGGGNGASAGDNNGSSGGSSSVGAHCAASGGAGGSGSSSTTGQTVGGGGFGGEGTVGQIQIDGSDGRNGRVEAGLVNQDGNGGASHMGGSVRSPGNTGAGAGGSLGKQYGGGGSGAINGSANVAAAGGGDGAPGIVIVEVFV